MIARNDQTVTTARPQPCRGARRGDGAPRARAKFARRLDRRLIHRARGSGPCAAPAATPGSDHEVPVPFQHRHPHLRAPLVLMVDHAAAGLRRLPVHAGRVGHAVGPAGRRPAALARGVRRAGAPCRSRRCRIGPPGARDVSRRAAVYGEPLDATPAQLRAWRAERSQRERALRRRSRRPPEGPSGPAPAHRLAELRSPPSRSSSTSCSV